MSHPPAFSAASGLASRTDRYCVRAKELAADPNLTADTAEPAMQHLARLQKDLATARLAACRSLSAELRLVEDDFKPLETRLKQARGDLSNALLRARPDGAGRFGLRPHGTAAVAANNSPASPAETASVLAVSACRSLLDLEELRPYLSDHALRQAIEKHGRVTGRHDLRGVAYACLPDAAHLPCEVQ